MRDMTTSTLEMSNAARAMLATGFAHKTSLLTFDMSKTIPSPQAQQVLDELSGLGLVDALPGTRGGMTYRLSETGLDMDRTAPGEGLSEKIAFLKEHAKFSIYAKAPETGLSM